MAKYNLSMKIFMFSIVHFEFINFWGKSYLQAYHLCGMFVAYSLQTNSACVNLLFLACPAVGVPSMACLFSSLKSNLKVL